MKSHAELSLMRTLKGPFMSNLPIENGVCTIKYLFSCCAMPTSALDLTTTKKGIRLDALEGGPSMSDTDDVPIFPAAASSHIGH